MDPRLYVSLDFPDTNRPKRLLFNYRSADAASSTELRRPTWPVWSAPTPIPSFKLQKLSSADRLHLVSASFRPFSPGHTQASLFLSNSEGVHEIWPNSWQIYLRLHFRFSRAVSYLNNSRLVRSASTCILIPNPPPTATPDNLITDLFVIPSTLVPIVSGRPLNF